MADVFRARVVDMTATSLMIEVTGDEQKVDGLVEVLQPLGIIEMVRTGAVAMARGNEALRSESNAKVCGAATLAQAPAVIFHDSCAGEVRSHG